MRPLIRLSSQKIVTDSQSIGLIARFFDGVVKQAKDTGLTSDDHFTVDGSLIQSHASLKSLKRIESEALARENAKPDGDDPTIPPSGGAPHKRSRNENVDFRGERRGNATHRSTTDPDARLARKGSNVGAFLCHSVHALTENRHGLVLAIAVAEANGRAERECALEMVDRVRQQHHVRVATLGADMGYDSGDFLVELKRRKIIGACCDSFRRDCCNGCWWSRAICSTRTTAAQGLWHKSTTTKDCRGILRMGQDDLDHAEIETHRAIQDQTASAVDCGDLQPRANVQAARWVTAP